MRKKIMDAAVEIINQDGYESLSIRKIANKIEYSPTTIYLYYKDKAQIITDIADELYKKTVVNATAILNEKFSDSLDNQIREILVVFIKSLTDEAEMAKAVIYSGINAVFSSESSATIPTNPGIEMLDQLLSSGIEKNLFKPNIRNTSWMIISALLGFVMNSIESKLYLMDDFNQLANSFVEILMGGIAQQTCKNNFI